jgi:putative redox protein
VVTVEHEKTASGQTMHRKLQAHGALTDEQRASLVRIAELCPIHKMLTGAIEIRTELAAAS